jgi:hypothetical protein
VINVSEQRLASRWSGLAEIAEAATGHEIDAGVDGAAGKVEQQLFFMARPDLQKKNRQH